MIVEPIREEDDIAAESQCHGLRRPREVSTESEGHPETPGKINRRHTLGSLPSCKTEERQSVRTSPVASSKDSMRIPCETVSSSSPCTPNANSCSQVLKSWTADSSQKDPPSPTLGHPSPFRLGGLFHRRGSLKSPEPLTIQLADGSPRGGNLAILGGYLFVQLEVIICSKSSKETWDSSQNRVDLLKHGVDDDKDLQHEPAR
ncbi:unnamed protein product [Ranitomeya imitator]|uniref:Uncharacterized protein n=1 Tax=Ranitomeya imitator TaxID=111125 RepID=A0ABN9LDM6_9NEOB|nr:unnamed protein product [Ranitomeya imitator]